MLEDITNQHDTLVAAKRFSALDKAGKKKGWGGTGATGPLLDVVKQLFNVSPDEPEVCPHPPNNLSGLMTDSSIGRFRRE